MDKVKKAITARPVDADYLPVLQTDYLDSKEERGSTNGTPICAYSVHVSAEDSSNTNHNVGVHPLIGNGRVVGYTH
ncbi:MAG: hypothetical protein Q7K40_00330 [bacterium]|nr:hypothetical protein [bacterium]